MTDDRPSSTSGTSLSTHTQPPTNTPRAPTLPPPPMFLPTPGNPAIPWPRWIKLFNTYLHATGGRAHTPDMKEAILQHLLGPEGQRVLEHLDPPEHIPPGQGDIYNTTILTLSAYYGKKTNIVVERHKFLRRTQGPQETTDTYLLALKTLVATCGYGNTVNDALRDQFVLHLADTSIQEKCLDEDNLTLERAVAIAHRAEQTSASLASIKAKEKGPENPEVQAIHNKPRPDLRPRPRTPTPATQTHPPTRTKGCYRCGALDHRSFEPQCPATQATCSACNKVGHYAKVCRTRLALAQNRPPRTVTQIQDAGHTDTDDPYDTDPNPAPAPPRFVLHIQSDRECPTCIVSINGHDTTVTVDSGSPYTLINEDTYSNITTAHPENPDFAMDAYGSVPIHMVGSATVDIAYKDRQIKARVHITKKGSNLLGWEHQGGLHMVLRPGTHNPVSTIQAQENEATAHPIVTANPTVFTDKMGRIKQFEHKLKLKQDAVPVAHKVRDIPFRVRQPLRTELDRLENLGIIEPITQSEWLFPTVIVNKPDNSIRLCVDLTDLNKQIWQERYPAPKIREMLASIGNPTRFSVLDLSSAYHQVPLHQSSRHLTSFITPEGAYRFKRMPFGLSTASAVFQRIMDATLEGIANTRCFQDDILVYGDTNEAHDATLGEVVQRLSKQGITLKPKKCQINKETVTYLGHELTKDGIHPKESLVHDIQSATPPKDKETLRSFLGLAEFYHKFVRDFATKSAPLRHLLKNNVPYTWSTQCQDSFTTLKTEIANATALRTFDPELTTIVYTDASQEGLGAILAQTNKDQEHIIGYASRALSTPEAKYSTIEREALACWWGINHFRHYLWGAPFTLRTDHRPLVHIMSTTGSAHATPRIANWYARLLPYQYTIEYVPGKGNHPADTMSRMTPADAPTCSPDEHWDTCTIINAIESHPSDAITQNKWKSAMENDASMQQAMSYHTTQWPKRAKDTIQNTEAYWAIKDQLTIEADILKRGERLVVPDTLRSTILDTAHQAHNGIQALKRTLRDTYWWPAMDKEIEEKVRWCIECSTADKSKRTQRAPLHPVKPPDKPWHTIGIDITGPMQLTDGTPTYALVAMDYMSRWPEVTFLEQIDTKAVIHALKDIFAREGTPAKIISDNGVQFVSAEMNAFLRMHDIHHATSALYHPQTNGLTERFNRTLKENIQLNTNSGLDWKAGVRNLLWSYRNTPTTITGHTPFQLMRGRIATSQLVPAWIAHQKDPHTNIEVITTKTANTQEKYKQQYDTRHNTKQSKWKQGDWVVIRKPGIHRKGQSAYSQPTSITEATDKYVITEDNRTWSVDRLAPHTAKHQDHTTPTPHTPQLSGDQPTNSQPEATSPTATGDTEGLNTQTEARPARTRNRPQWLRDYVEE